jgi:hypothetical protein
MTGEPDTQVSVEWIDRAASGPAVGNGCGIAHVVEAGRCVVGLRAGDLVLAPRAGGESATERLSAASCVSLPASLPLGRAAAVGPLALSLWTWDAAGLEPGEIAVFTSGSAADATLAAVAGWRSARDVIRLAVDDTMTSPLPGVIDLAAAESETTGTALAAALRAAPGAVAAVTARRTDALDLILEAAPMWARIVLASLASDPATIDFYGNVHRKGCHLLSVPGAPADMLNPPWIDAARLHVTRAARILQHDKLAGVLLT